MWPLIPHIADILTNLVPMKILSRSAVFQFNFSCSFKCGFRVYLFFCLFGGLGVMADVMDIDHALIAARRDDDEAVTLIRLGSFKIRLTPDRAVARRVHPSFCLRTSASRPFLEAATDNPPNDTRASTYRNADFISFHPT